MTTKRSVLSIFAVERNGVEFHESGPSGLLIEVFCNRGALFGAPRHVVFGCARTEALSCAVDDHAAIGSETVTGDELRITAGKEQDGRRDVVFR